MMIKFNYLIIFIILLNIYTINCYFEQCDQTVQLQSYGSVNINSPNYPNSQYPAGSSCRFNVISPPGHQLNAQCYLNFPMNGQSCGTEFFYLQSEGDISLSNSEYYCGSGYLSRTSLFNTLVLAYTSSSTATNAGYFTCYLTAYPVPCDCGWAITPRIVNGIEAQINEFTPMTAILYKPTAQVICGGAIINYRYILTAAHCFVSYNNPNTLSVLVGDHDITSGYDTRYSAIYDVENIILHETFNTITLQDDIAILRVTKDIAYSRAVGPACLPFYNSIASYEGVSVTAAGWGSREFGGPTSMKLQKVSLNILSNSNCAGQITKSLSSSQMCTFEATKDTCQYDSGGNLFLRLPRLYSIGVISYGFGCASIVPSVNTRVTAYLSWIESKTPDAIYCKK